MRYSREEKTAHLEEFKKFYESGKGSLDKFAKEKGLLPNTFGKWVAESEKYGVDIELRNRHTDEEKRAYLEEFKEFYESGEGTRKDFAEEKGLLPNTFGKWVAESEKYGVDIEVNDFYIDEEKRAHLEEFKEYYESGKGGRDKFAKEKGLASSVFCEWVVEAKKYGVDLDVQSRPLNKRKSPEQIREILEAWMEDWEERTLVDFGRAWSDPITERTIQNWAKNAIKYGLSQESVDKCRAKRLKTRENREYGDSERKGYVDGFFGQNESLEEYARLMEIPRKTLKNWVKDGEMYGWEKWRVDLALKAGARVGLTPKERAKLEEGRVPRQDQEVAGAGVSAPVEELPQEAAGSPAAAVPAQQAWESHTQPSLAEYATGGLRALEDSAGPLGSPALVAAATGGTALPGITSFDFHGSWDNSTPPSPSPLPSVPSDYLRGPGASAPGSGNGSGTGSLPALPKDVVPRADYFSQYAGSKGPARGGR
ncbi:hypothetical protein ACWD5R_18515 [Streptomyces sp. NPDC002514]|uniref:hypothetical protein n=1 Tax=Streptomyces sp. NPDC001270 TaxID=3364554 RepID=UPI0036A33998